MTEQITQQSLFPIDRFRRYRVLAAKRGYCDPFVPTVGDRYGSGTLPRIVYCGVAARWGDDGREPMVNDVRLFNEAADWSSNVFDERSLNSAFWRLLDSMLAKLDLDTALTASQRRRCAAWTNLSKSGRGYGATCPPDSDVELRALDIEQFNHELGLLDPDLLICVSGNNLVSTGKALFRRWPIVQDGIEVPDQSEVRRLPNGGWLYWTMHPQAKPSAWGETVLSGISDIAERLPARP